MHSATLSTSKHLGSLELTRNLLQQQTMTSLVTSLTRCVQLEGIADAITLVLFNNHSERVSFHAIDANDQPVYYEDETLLSTGPVRTLLDNPQIQVWQSEALHAAYPQLAALNLYPPFSHYGLVPLQLPAGLLGGCEFTRQHTRPFSEKEQCRLNELCLLVAIAVEQIQLRSEARFQQSLLRHERDDFRILVEITNAVLSRLDIDELIGEIAKTIHHFFHINTVGMVLCDADKESLQADVYTTSYGVNHLAKQQKSRMTLAGSLEQQVMQKGEMLLKNVQPSEAAGEEETLWREQIKTLCILPLRFGDKTLGVLKLAQGQLNNFSTANLRVLQQIAERIAIAVDNALAYQQIKSLKEKLQHENLYLTEQINSNVPDFGDIVGRSEGMSAVLKQVEIVAKSDCAVLILGETGTGKELIARAIHNLGDRRDRRMVKMNCAAMPAGLMESDLFGHEKGAFTGATTQRMGRFELADQGTLFLDEVGEIPLELQPKLLRILQEQEFERVGGNKLISVDVRLIAATNRNLQQMVADKAFRSDLFYRLNVFPIIIPPLRERPEDIPQLVKYLTYKIARRMKRTIDSIPAETLRLLSRMEWPGNVRELENVIERAVLLTRGTVLDLQLQGLGYPLPVAAPVVPQAGIEVAPAAYLSEDDERERILQVLKETNGVVAGPRGAAQRLGLKRTTLLSRMKKMGIAAR
ncbi:formate hydrogenlyase transcriptional activator [Enterobacter sp. BIGb0383]|uniref:formate hydrogenlyase transcriptional activator FlhA n=1 Tax=unclassified Enterobacter TaxID=2608935 RepID=UPI000F4775B5|nr:MULTISPECIES: formate hydrogenlyase transcriptional activator FlhA [unclassified Enterobacter]ROP59014.1 formate hydrogenlyase transcriptional activator [Enterobacter sp. BIGb0383]ROS09520.1 formate hydrogenlyase transcriptional activator [Enterobacter sp. BIGb0359]